MKTPAALLLSLALFSLAAHSQQPNYWPEAGDFACLNGHNRYTRALYGGHGNYRVETSDRPVFALFKNSKDCRNVAFALQVGGDRTPLDSTTHCKALYADGRRSYDVAHEGWRGRLKIETLCLCDSDAAVWTIRPEGFSPDDNPVLTIVETGVREKRLSRNGDIGVDPEDCFESDGIEHQRLSIVLSQPVTVVAGGFLLQTVDEEEARRLLAPTLLYNKELTERIAFRTPDDYINALAPALCLAADGAWDGQIWLHGAVGWRTQLAGWRAAYAGDVLGWDDRASSHFDAYARSQVTDVPPRYGHPTQDPAQQGARAEKRWGTQMYSNGYICRKPGRNDEMNHYDMNLNYVDELLWHFQYDADTARLRRFWPLLNLHRDWEKRNFDPDGDGLYDAYCCIWASDALYYSGGAVTHSTAYNYRANRLMAQMARLLGEDQRPYQQEADKILKAMNQTLWLNDEGHWAEYKDLMGLKRLHKDAAVWSVYTPVDCGACSAGQAWQATGYVAHHIPHLPVDAGGELQTISTSDWMPYCWSINNVAAAEVMHTALAFFEAGRSEEGFKLLKANVMDQMYLGASPGNFGQISRLDAARGECYRDFGDCIGISARTLLQGLFGIVPQALSGECILRPGLPQEWDSASVATPYLSYDYRREGNVGVYTVRQRFRQPLKIIFRQHLGAGTFRDYEGNADSLQVFRIPEHAPASPEPQQCCGTHNPSPVELGLEEPSPTFRRRRQVSLDAFFNANVTDIFSNQYLSPRPPVTTLQMPWQGVGEWCHPHETHEISDAALRSPSAQGVVSVAGVSFRTPQQGRNIVFTSLWDNYPDSIDIPLKGRASAAYLLMAGTTNHMQCHIDNALVVATYADGSRDTLRLVNPYNWCPIEQDFFVDGNAFSTLPQRPYRLALATGTVSRNLGQALAIPGVYGREIPGGAAQMLKMPLNPRKRLRRLTLRTLSNDVVAGLMAITLEQ